MIGIDIEYSLGGNSGDLVFGSIALLRILVLAAPPPQCGIWLVPVTICDNWVGASTSFFLIICFSYHFFMRDKLENTYVTAYL